MLMACLAAGKLVLDQAVAIYQWAEMAEVHQADQYFVVAEAVIEIKDGLC